MSFAILIRTRADQQITLFARVRLAGSCEDRIIGVGQIADDQTEHPTGPSGPDARGREIASIAEGKDRLADSSRQHRIDVGLSVHVTRNRFKSDSRATSFIVGVLNITPHSDARV